MSLGRLWTYLPAVFEYIILLQSIIVLFMFTKLVDKKILSYFFKRFVFYLITYIITLKGTKYSLMVLTNEAHLLCATTLVIFILSLWKDNPLSWLLSSMHCVHASFESYGMCPYLWILLLSIISEIHPGTFILHKLFISCVHEWRIILLWISVNKGSEFFIWDMIVTIFYS